MGGGAPADRGGANSAARRHATQARAGSAWAGDSADITSCDSFCATITAASHFGSGRRNDGRNDHRRSATAGGSARIDDNGDNACRRKAAGESRGGSHRRFDDLARHEPLEQ